jgi:hypothetical protein
MQTSHLSENSSSFDIQNIETVAIVRDTTTANYLEGVQIANCRPNLTTKPSGPIYRVGTSFVDFQELESEEVAGLISAEGIAGHDAGNEPIFCGPSSNATLIKKAIEIKSAFVGKPVGIPDDISTCRARDHRAVKTA